MCLGPLRRVLLTLATSITQVHLGSRGEGLVPCAKLAICRRLEINDRPPTAPPARLPQTWWELVSYRCQQNPWVPPIVFYPPHLFSLSFSASSSCETPASHSGVLPWKDVGLEWICFGGAQRPSTHLPPLRGSRQVERHCASSCLSADCSSSGQLLQSSENPGEKEGRQRKRLRHAFH